MKVKVPDNHCRNCVWLINKQICPFRRCVNGFGFITDKKVIGNEYGNE